MVESPGFSRGRSQEQYASNETEYARLEGQARNAGRDLWSQANPIPPWEWRDRTSGPSETASRDRDCSDFETQSAAQRFFERHQPGDPHGLDAVALRFEDAGSPEVATRLVFTPDKFDTFTGISTEEDCDGVLIPGAMETRRRVLVPLRGLENLPRIVPFVVDLCGKDSARVTLLYGNTLRRPEWRAGALRRSRSDAGWGAIRRASLSGGTFACHLAKSKKDSVPVRREKGRGISSERVSCLEGAGNFGSELPV